MAFIFQNPVNKTIDNLIKHLDTLLSENEDDQNKAIIKLSDDIAQIHFILYGNSVKDPNPDHITKLVPKLLQPDTDLFCKLATYINQFQFEATKQTADIMNYIIRRCTKYHSDKYIKNKTDKHGHNVIIDCLLRGYHNQHLAQNVGSVLREMSKRQELAHMLLNTIRITRKKTHIKVRNYEEKTNNKPDVSEMEERQVIDELFILVQKPSFDIASDAYKTLQLLLTRNKKLIPKYLQLNYNKFFSQFNALIQSNNYVTQRQFLNLLSELLLEKINFNLMIKYIAEKENLKIVMTLLKNDSHAIAYDAFHIFKAFVANPKKERSVHIVLWKNQKKLITFLQNFLIEKEDEMFINEKKTIIKYLEDLSMPEEIAIRMVKKQQKQRAKSQVQALLNSDPNMNCQSGIHKSKSIPNVKPPTTVQHNENNEEEQMQKEPPKNDDK